MSDIYTDNGYTDRAEYLDSLAAEFAEGHGAWSCNVVTNPSKSSFGPSISARF